MILVTGAAGKTGRAIISGLVALGQPVRALVHREVNVPAVESVGAKQVIVGDMRSKSVVADAFRGVDKAYHICPNVNADEVSMGRIAIDAALDAHIDLFVFHSVLHPQIEAMPHHWNKLRVEETLLESKLPFAILQPASYMQNILGEWQAIAGRGVYAVPYSVEARMSVVDLEDVARAAATVLCEPDYQGGTYELGGPVVLSPKEMAVIMGHELGRDVRAEKISVEGWKERAMASGLSEYSVEALIRMFDYYDRYGLVGNSHVLRSLIGRSPTTFEEFIKRTVREPTR